MDKNNINVSLTMSDDRTVFSIVLSANEAIGNRELAEVLLDHVAVLSNAEAANVRA